MDRGPYRNHTLTETQAETEVPGEPAEMLAFQLVNGPLRVAYREGSVVRVVFLSRETGVISREWECLAQGRPAAAVGEEHALVATHLDDGLHLWRDGAALTGERAAIAVRGDAWGLFADGSEPRL